MLLKLIILSKGNPRAPLSVPFSRPPHTEGGGMPESGNPQGFSTKPDLFTDHRNAARVFIRLPAWITIGSAQSQEHVAFVRDISPRGIFFYSKVRLNSGQHVEFVLEYLKGNNRIRLQLAGHVVRVEQATSTSAIGVAIAFDTVHDEVPNDRSHAS